MNSLDAFQYWANEIYVVCDSQSNITEMTNFRWRNVFDDICRISQRSFSSWIDVSRSTCIFHEDMRKNDFRSQWPWPLTLNLLSQLLVSRSYVPCRTRENAVDSERRVRRSSVCAHGSVAHWAPIVPWFLSSTHSSFARWLLAWNYWRTEVISASAVAFDRQVDSSQAASTDISASTRSPACLRWSLCILFTAGVVCYFDTRARSTGGSICMTPIILIWPPVGRYRVGLGLVLNC